MAEIYRVNIKFSSQSEKLLKIPETIRVPQFSIIQWNIVGLNKNLIEDSKFWRKGLIFTIYFDDKTPFRWKRQFVQVHDEPHFYPNFPNRMLRLAEDSADEKGDYKYGVRVSEAESDETLYDEDPLIIVY